MIHAAVAAAVASATNGQPSRSRPSEPSRRTESRLFSVMLSNLPVRQTIGIRVLGRSCPVDRVAGRRAEHRRLTPRRTEVAAAAELAVLNGAGVNCAGLPFRPLCLGQCRQFEKFRVPPSLQSGMDQRSMGWSHSAEGRRSSWSVMRSTGPRDDLTSSVIGLWFSSRWPVVNKNAHKQLQNCRT